MTSDAADTDDSGNDLKLAENLRRTIAKFVRGIRSQANTPTTSQSETLSLLERNGPLTVAELAGHRNVKHQSMRLVTAALELDELIARSANPADARSQLLSLTDKGRKELAWAREARTAEIAALIEERLSDEDKSILQAAILVIERLS